MDPSRLREIYTKVLDVRQMRPAEVSPGWALTIVPELLAEIERLNAREPVTLTPTQWNYILIALQQREGDVTARALVAEIAGQLVKGKSAAHSWNGALDASDQEGGGDDLRPKD